MTHEVAIKIGTKSFVGWETLEITRSLDNFSIIRLSAPFDPENEEFRELFKPFTYEDIQVDVDGKRLFTGTLVAVEPRATAKSTTVAVSGYALPGVLADATMPASEFPIEYGDHTLFQIADSLARPFGVAVVSEVDAGPQFKRVRIRPAEKVGKFLIDLAKARGVIMRDNEAGDLVFLETADTGNPVAYFREGISPLVSVAATFSPQSYYSEITGLSRTKAGRKGGAGYTATNKHLPETVRPLNFVVGDVNAGDLPGAVKAKMARMFGNIVAYVVETPTWEDENGLLWAPNSTVTLYAPGAMVYEQTELLIRDVTLRIKANAVSASLGLVLPGAFTGLPPETLPWQT